MKHELTCIILFLSLQKNEWVENFIVTTKIPCTIMFLWFPQDVSSQPL
jgi:hypothetical protein